MTESKWPVCKIHKVPMLFQRLEPEVRSDTWPESTRVLYYAFFICSKGDCLEMANEGPWNRIGLKSRYGIEMN